MDKDTVALYETDTDEWISRRSPKHNEEATAFGTRVPAPPGAVGDLGCGPGWYARLLPAPVVAVDAAHAMLLRARANAPHVHLVQGDLEALPLRRGALRGAWASNSYVHLPRARVPLALADLHRALAPGSPVVLIFFGPDGDEGDEGTELFPGADLPGRFFSRWTTDELGDVLHGAGFGVDDLDHRTNERGERAVHVHALRLRTLPDTVGPAMRLLVCGLNPSIFAADAGIGFARPNNRFWQAARLAGVVSVDRDPRRALLENGIGMTDLVKRATVAAAELTSAEYRIGFARVDRLVRWLRPGAVCFVGLAGWRTAVDRLAAAGRQPTGIGGVPAYVMPSTSGLNARTSITELAEHLQAAAALAKGRRAGRRR